LRELYQLNLLKWVGAVDVDFGRLKCGIQVEERNDERDQIQHLRDVRRALSDNGAGGRRQTCLDRRQ